MVFNASYDSWIYDYLCNQCPSLLTLWVRITFWRGVLDTTLCDKIYQWLATGRWFFRVLISPTNKTDSHDIAEILFDQVTFRTFHSPILGGILRYVLVNSVYHTYFTTVKHSVSPTIFSWFSYHATCRIEYSLIKIRSPRLLPISYRLFNSRRVEAPVPVFGITVYGG
jgi:hypothetical protein